MADTVNEKSPYRVSMAFTDFDDQPVAPTSVDWRLEDEDGNELKSWTALGGPAANMSVVVGGSFHVISDDNRTKEGRVFGVRIDDGLSTEGYEEFHYQVMNLHGIT